MENAERQQQQEERRQIMKRCRDLAEAARATEDATCATEKLAEFELQRQALLPRTPGEQVRFQVGRKSESGWAPAEVEATLDSDAWLHKGEPCIDCEGALELPDWNSEANSGRVECGCCRAVYSIHSELWLDEIDRRVCENCGMAAEADDGGPDLCFRCRRVLAVPTVCSGCGGRHSAAPMDPAESARACDSRHRPPKELRLCARCTVVATSTTEQARRDGMKATTEFLAAAERYGSIGQAVESVAVAGMLGRDAALPERRDWSMWSTEATRAATRWIRRQVDEDAGQAREMTRAAQAERPQAPGVH